MSVNLPEVNSVSMKIPAFFIQETKKGWKLVNPLNATRNLSTRKGLKSIDIERAKVDDPSLDIADEGFEPPHISEFSKADQAKIRKYWAGRFNQRKGKPRGRPVYLEKNAEHHGIPKSNKKTYSDNPKGGDIPITHSKRKKPQLKKISNPTALLKKVEKLHRAKAQKEINKPKPAVVPSIPSHNITIPTLKTTAPPKRKPTLEKVRNSVEEAYERAVKEYEDLGGPPTPRPRVPKYTPIRVPKPASDLPDLEPLVVPESPKEKTPRTPREVKDKRVRKLRAHHMLTDAQDETAKLIRKLGFAVLKHEETDTPQQKAEKDRINDFNQKKLIKALEANQTIDEAWIQGQLKSYKAKPRGRSKKESKPFDFVQPGIGAKSKKFNYKKFTEKRNDALRDVQVKYGQEGSNKTVDILVDGDDVILPAYSKLNPSKKHKTINKEEFVREYEDELRFHEGQFYIMGDVDSHIFVASLRERFAPQKEETELRKETEVHPLSPKQEPKPNKKQIEVAKRAQKESKAQREPELNLGEVSSSEEEGSEEGEIKESTLTKSHIAQLRKATQQAREAEESSSEEELDEVYVKEMRRNTALGKIAETANSVRLHELGHAGIEATGPEIEELSSSGSEYDSDDERQRQEDERSGVYGSHSNVGDGLFHSSGCGLMGGKLPVSEIQKFVEASYKNTDDAKSVGRYELDEDLSTKLNKVYRDPNTGHVVIANAGTSSLMDWKNNLNPFGSVLFGNYDKTDRYKDIENTQKRAIEKYGKHNVENVGHSQSGEALRILAKRGLINESTAVNPAILGKSHEGVDVIKSDRDLVSMLTPMGDKDTTIKAETWNPLTEHSAEILNRITTGGKLKISSYSNMNHGRMSGCGHKVRHPALASAHSELIPGAYNNIRPFVHGGDLQAKYRNRPESGEMGGRLGDDMRNMWHKIPEHYHKPIEEIGRHAASDLGFGLGGRLGDDLRKLWHKIPEHYHKPIEELARHGAHDAGFGLGGRLGDKVRDLWHKIPEHYHKPIESILKSGQKDLGFGLGAGLYAGGGSGLYAGTGLYAGGEIGDGMNGGALPPKSYANTAPYDDEIEKRKKVGTKSSSYTPKHIPVAEPVHEPVYEAEPVHEMPKKKKVNRGKKARKWASFVGNEAMDTARKVADTGMYIKKLFGGKLQKGSPEAKEFMAKLRARKGKVKGGDLPPRSRGIITDPSLI